MRGRRTNGGHYPGLHSCPSEGQGPPAPGRHVRSLAEWYGRIGCSTPPVVGTFADSWAGGGDHRLGADPDGLGCRPLDNLGGRGRGSPQLARRLPRLYVVRPDRTLGAIRKGALLGPSKWTGRQNAREEAVSRGHRSDEPPGHAQEAHGGGEGPDHPVMRGMGRDQHYRSGSAEEHPLLPDTITCHWPLLRRSC